MKAVFRDRFAELVRTFIHSKRERDEYELRDRSASHRERGFQRRLASLERGQGEFDAFVEAASLEIEHLHSQLGALLVERGIEVHCENKVPVAFSVGRKDMEKLSGDETESLPRDSCLDQRSIKRHIDEWVEI